VVLLRYGVKSRVADQRTGFRTQLTEMNRKWVAGKRGRIQILAQVTRRFAEGFEKFRGIGTVDECCRPSSGGNPKRASWTDDGKHPTCFASQATELLGKLAQGARNDRLD